MNTLQISNVLQKHKSTNKYFRGVFASNQLPNVIQKPAIIIANTDPSNEPGSHWVAFYFDVRNKGEYFDSSGQYPHKKEFLNFIRRNCNKFSYNKQQTQGFFSSTCGHYCIMYALYKSQNKSFLKLFDKLNLKSNDIKIVKLFKKEFKTIKMRKNKKL